MKPRAAVAGLCLGILTACNSSLQNQAGPASGAAVGIGVGGITANPLIGYAAGIGTQAAISALQKYLARKLHQGEQDNIAATVATLQLGQSAPWQIHYKIPVENEHGNLTVTQIIPSALTTCKQIAFSIITSNQPGAAQPIYITTICRQPAGNWKWAEAEPATSRWGFLQ